MDKLWLNGELADLGEERAAINFQVWSLLTLENRQTPYSFGFTLPDTVINRRLLGIPIMGSQTTIPYSRTPAMYEAGGVFIIGPGGYVIVENINEACDYICQIYGGSAEFFSIIKEAMLSDLTSLDHYQWKIEQILNDGDQKYWPLIDWNSESPTVYIDDNPDPMYGGLKLDFRTLYPGAFLKDIIQAIFTDNGYQIYDPAAPAWTDAKFLRMFIPCLTQKANATAKAQMKLAWVQRVSLGDVADDISAILLANQTWFWNRIAIVVQNFEYIIESQAQGIQPDVCVYNVRSKGWYGFHVTLAMDWAAGALPHTLAYSVVFKPAGGPWTTLYGYQFHIDTNAGSIAHDINQNIYIGEGGLLALSIYDAAWEGGRPIYARAGYFRCVTCEPENTHYYHDFGIAINLPELSQADMLKVWLNLTCSMLWVDEESKMVYVHQFSELYQNAPENWSSYFDSIVECKYHAEGYGQNNYLQYSNDDTVIVDTGKQLVTITDAALPEDVDLITCSLSASNDVKHGGEALAPGGIDMAKIALRVLGGPSGSITGRILLNDEYTLDDDIYVYNPLYPGYGIPISPVWIATFAGLEFATLLQEYHIELFTRCMDKARIIRANFLLPATVIKGHRPNVPVYVKQLNGLFYCDIIENYVAGEMCIVQLIRL